MNLSKLSNVLFEFELTLIFAMMPFLFFQQLLISENIVSVNHFHHGIVCSSNNRLCTVSHITYGRHPKEELSKVTHYFLVFIPNL